MIWPSIVVALAGLWPQGTPARPLEVQGKIANNTVWRGTVRLVGDVEVPFGAELRIAAGTRVLVAKQDGSHGGWNKSRIELHVKGNLRIQGAERNPVVFGPRRSPGDRASDGGTGSLPGTSATWHGIVIWPYDADRVVRQLRFAEFHQAYAAIQTPESSPAIFGCSFFDCGTGIEVGSAFVDTSRRARPDGTARPMIESCRFTSCWTGVFAEARGSPTILRSIFTGCRLAVGNNRNGWSGPLEMPGVILNRCDVLHCRNGVLGPGIVTNSIFAWNGTALQPSFHHSTHMTRIDQVAYRANLFFANQKILAGESGIGVDTISANPGFVGSPEHLPRGGPPLPKALALRPDSPARGRATDGGDLGAIGKLSVGSHHHVWSPAGQVATHMLAFRVRPKKRRGKPVAPSRPPLASPGKAAHGSWWVVPGAHEQGTIRLDRTFGGLGSGWVAVRLETETASDLQLEINGDLRQLVIYWNGKKVHTLHSRRRFHEHGIELELQAKEGANRLLLWTMAWGNAPILGITFKSMRGAGVVEPDPARKAPPAPTVLSSKIVREKKRRFLQVKLSEAMSWTMDGMTGRAQILGSDAKPLPGTSGLRLHVRSGKSLRIGPLPSSLRKPFFLKLTDLRDAWGRVHTKLALHEVK